MKPDNWPDYCDRCPNWDGEQDECRVFLSFINEGSNPRKPLYPMMRDGVCRAYNWTPTLIGKQYERQVAG